MLRAYAKILLHFAPDVTELSVLVYSKTMDDIEDLPAFIKITSCNIIHVETDFLYLHHYSITFSFHTFFCI